MGAAPFGELVQLAGWRNANVACDVQFYAGRERDPSPHRAFDRRHRCLLEWPRPVVERAPDVIEGVPGFLEGFHPQQLLKVLGAVMIPASEAVGLRKQPFLNVVADCPAGDAAKICEIADGVARFVGHTAVI